MDDRRDEAGRAAGRPHANLKRLSADLNDHEKKRARVEKERDDTENELVKAVCEAIEGRVREKISIARCDWTASYGGLPYCDGLDDFHPVFYLENGGIIKRVRVGNHGSTIWSYTKNEGKFANGWEMELGVISMEDHGEDPKCQSHLARIYDAQQELGLDKVEHLAQVEREFREYLIPSQRTDPLADYTPVTMVTVERKEYRI